MFSVGFTEAKIEKFGSAFVNLIKSTVPVGKSIREILEQHPLPNEINVSHTAEITYTFFSCGKTVSEIANERFPLKKSIKLFFFYLFFFYFTEN